MRRRAAVAGSWYSGDPARLSQTVDDYLAGGRASSRPRAEDIVGLLAPHAGLMYLGPVAGHAYATLEGRVFDVAVIVGPSHHVAFEGVSVWPDGVFETPLGDITVDAATAAALVRATPAIVVRRDAHRDEHSLEMQLPFLATVLPAVPIVPLVMGAQTRDTIEALARALADACRNHRALLVASSDLSHFFDAATAETLDARVADFVAGFDAEGLLGELERYPEHERGQSVMCGGGPAVSVMLAARALGATRGRVLARAHSGHVSGDFERVVGYLAAGFTRQMPEEQAA